MGASKFPNEQNSKLIDENGLPIDATNPLDVSVKNFPSSQTVQIDASANAIKIDQTTEGANGVEIVNTPTVYVDNLQIPGSTKPLKVEGNVIVYNQSTGGVSIPLSTQLISPNGSGGVNVSLVDAAGNLQVEVNNFPTTQAVSGTVDIGTMPAITVSDVGIKTTANTVKIDQATAGANNIRIVDKTNTSHVATVANNGSVHTVITNNNASAVPTTITNTPNVNVSTLPSVQIDQVTANANRVQVANASGVIANGNPLAVNINANGVPSVLASLSFSPANPLYVASSSTFPVVTNNRVLGSGTTWLEERRADRYQQSEWNGLTNGSGFTIYTNQFGGAYKIRVTQIIVTVTNAGVYVFNFENGSGGTALFLKTRLPANTPHTLTFSNGILSPYTANGVVRLYNNTGGNSDVNTTVQAWEE